MINHLAAICRFSFPNHNFFPVLSLRGRLGASIGVCFFVILKNYFQYFCPVLSILIYFRVFPADGEECSIFLTFSTFPKNADFFFWAIMEQDTTGIICFIKGFFDGCTSWWSQRCLRCYCSSSYLVLLWLCHKSRIIVWRASLLWRSAPSLLYCVLQRCIHENHANHVRQLQFRKQTTAPAYRKTKIVLNSKIIRIVRKAKQNIVMCRFSPGLEKCQICMLWGLVEALNYKD